jgi:hypothetical protein
MKLSNLLMTSLVFSGASLVLAQSTEPPPIIKIVREDMKPGKSMAHERTESAYARAFSKTKFPNYIGWEAMSGQTQAWFVEGYADYAGIEAASKVANTEPLKTTLDQLDVQDSELRTGERTMIARYQKDMSYLPAPFDLPKAHFVWVDVIRMHYGRGEDFREMRKIEKAAFEKVGSKRPNAVYRVSEGAVAGTYLLVLPMESLKTLDEMVNWNTREVLGDQFDRYHKFRTDLIISSEPILFAINPKMSNPPKAYVDADPEFWTSKPKPASK